MTIEQKAMLVELTIHQWTATRHDKTVSSQVEQQHQAKNAGRYNKRLVDKTFLEQVNKAANDLRAYHYSRTLPWADKGPRLLPSALFLEYRAGITQRRDLFNVEVNKFVALYPDIVNEAQKRLKSLFDREDYPSTTEIRLAFGVDMDIMPLPGAADFRVSISEDDIAQVREQITDAVQQRQAKAMKDCWYRVQDVLKRIAEQCGKEKSRIHDSLIENARDLVDVLGGLNFTGDPQITEMQASIREQLLIPTTRLREDAALRKQTADSASELLKKVSWCLSA